MRIAIVGCGAMGSVYAGLFASAGHDVVAITRNRDHVEAINRAGLRVEGASGDRTSRLRAVTIAPAEAMEMVVLAVKAAHVADASREAVKLLDAGTVVLTIQNGLGSSDIVADIVGKDRLAVGIAGGFGAALVAAGHVFHNGMQKIQIGAYGDLQRSQIDWIAGEWRGAGFNAEAVRDIAAMQWEKLICNVAYSAPCALTGLTVGALMDDPDMGPVSRLAAIEAWSVGLVRGIAIAVEDPVEHARAFAARMPNAKPSVLLDIEAGRRSEVGVINGAIPREAEKISEKAPVNETLTALVHVRERAFSA